MINSHKVTKHSCTSSWSPLAHSIHHTYHQVTVMNKQQKKNKGCKQLIYIYISHVNVTQTVPDISPLMPMHQDPLLVLYCCHRRVSMVVADNPAPSWHQGIRAAVMMTWAVRCWSGIPNKALYIHGIAATGFKWSYMGDPLQVTASRHFLLNDRFSCMRECTYVRARVYVNV